MSSTSGSGLQTALCAGALLAFASSGQSAFAGELGEADYTCTTIASDLTDGIERILGRSGSSIPPISLDAHGRVAFAAEVAPNVMSGGIEILIGDGSQHAEGGSSFHRVLDDEESLDPGDQGIGLTINDHGLVGLSTHVDSALGPAGIYVKQSLGAPETPAEFVALPHLENSPPAINNLGWVFVGGGGGLDISLPGAEPVRVLDMQHPFDVGYFYTQGQMWSLARNQPDWLVPVIGRVADDLSYIHAFAVSGAVRSQKRISAGSTGTFVKLAALTEGAKPGVVHALEHFHPDEPYWWSIWLDDTLLVDSREDEVPSWAGSFSANSHGEVAIAGGGELYVVGPAGIERVDCAADPWPMLAPTSLNNDGSIAFLASTPRADSPPFYRTVLVRADRANRRPSVCSPEREGLPCDNANPVVAGVCEEGLCVDRLSDGDPTAALSCGTPNCLLAVPEPNAALQVIAALVSICWLRQRPPVLRL